MRQRAFKSSWSGLLFAVLITACQPQTPDSEALDATGKETHSGNAHGCESLSGVEMGTATIESAEFHEQGEHVVSLFKRVLLKVFVEGLPDISAPADFCRVKATLRPLPDSKISTEIWLPEQWNGKFLALGGSGFNGSLGMGSLLMQDPLKKGYASMVTDSGHSETNSARFAYDSEQQFIDYAYRANHVAAVFAKSLVTSYHGTPVTRSYFHGCSNGGRDALMQALRYPGDYEGIIAGAPAAGWSRMATAFAWNAQAIKGVPQLEKKLPLIQRAVMETCDEDDGIADKLLENPLTCSFQPRHMQCSNENTEDCLTAEEVAAIEQVYAGPHLSDGSQVYAGLSKGGEGLENNWDAWLFSGDVTQAMFATETFRWMVYGDPKWEVSDFDIDKDYPMARKAIVDIMDSDDPDLTKFTSQGGKLLLYHGWNDAAIPAEATVNYHSALREALGSQGVEQVRLFMVPGMAHCFGGVGPTSFDILSELDRWVESNTPPSRILASEFSPPALFGPADDATLIRTRPLCPWPKTAHYSGAGSSDSAENFECK